MKKFKHWFYAAAAAAMLSATACSDDDAPVIISAAQLEGDWYECYDTPLFQMDGLVEYKFKTDGTYKVSVYDVFSDQTTLTSHSYQLNGDLLVLRTELPSALQDSFQIVSYKPSEMAWQRIGTTYSLGTLSSDYMHFKRSQE